MTFNEQDIVRMLRRVPELRKMSIDQVREHLTCELDRGPDADPTYVEALAFALALRTENGDTWVCGACGAVHPWFVCPDGTGCTAMGCPY